MMKTHPLAALATLLLVAGCAKDPPAAPVAASAAAGVGSPGGSPAASTPSTLAAGDRDRAIAMLAGLEQASLERQHNRIISADAITAVDNGMYDSKKLLEVRSGIQDVRKIRSFLEEITPRLDLDRLDAESAMLVAAFRGWHYMDLANLVATRQIHTRENTFVIKDPGYAEFYEREVPPTQGARELFLLKSFIDSMVLSVERLSTVPVAPRSFAHFGLLLFEIPRTVLTHEWRPELGASARAALDAAEGRIFPEGVADQRGLRRFCVQLWRLGRTDMRGERMVRMWEGLKVLTGALRKSGYIDEDAERALLDLHRGANRIRESGL